MTFIKEKPVVKVDSTDREAMYEARQKLVELTAEQGASVVRNLSALGYSPLGDQDPNFSPEYRRRYYMTEASLREHLESLFKNGKNGNDAENPDCSLDTFKRDVQWFVTNRNDIHQVQSS